MAEYRSRRRFVVDGSNALKAEPVTPERPRRRKKVYRRRVLTNAQVSTMPAIYGIFAAVAFSLIVACSGLFIHEKTAVYASNKTIKSLETELAQIKDDNQELLNEISTATNVNTIRDKAIKELGMVAASSSQVIYYESTDTEYVRQKEDIPNE